MFSSIQSMETRFPCSKMTPTRKPENEGHLNIYHSNKTQFVDIYVLTIKSVVLC